MPNCNVCGEPMPAGEEMFKFHGYSGPCPKPPLADSGANPVTFDNGLSRDQDDALDGAIIACGSLVSRIEDLGRHRSYSLAVTNLEQAKHWLRDRKHKPA